MSDRFLYSGDDAAMMSELQHCHLAARQHSGVSSESEAGTSMTLFPECDLTFLQKCTCNFANPYLTIRLMSVSLNLRLLLFIT